MPIDTTQISEPNPPSPDRRAKDEEDFLAKNREKRQNSMEVTVHRVMTIIIVFFFLLILSIMVCRGLHLILPTSAKWLSDEQIVKIDEFFVHGTIGAIMIAGIRMILKKANWTSEQ
jgi:hypothetical protein